jgi:predicted ATPase/class 3 adenylate cyclase
MGELEGLQQAIAALEAQRAILGDAVVDAALGPMREKLAALLAAGEPEPEPQRKLATVLFMDIAGHTALTHHLDPEELMEVVDIPLSRLAKRVVEHGGRVVRYQGDGFKAVFGLPKADENDTENAIRTGLAIQATAAEIAGQLEREHGLRGFAVRVGIATGLVLGGGGGTEGEDTVKGEPVNLAARLESAAQPGTVLIAHSTYQHVRGVFDFHPLEPIHAKGFEEPVPVYRVLAARPRSFRTRRRGVEGVETRMVGREGELGQLQDIFSALLKDCRRQFVTVVGEPGLGKSRLLYEFENWVDLQPVHVHSYRGRSRLETRRLPYGLLRDLLATEFEIHDSDSEAVAREKMEKGFAQIGGPESADWAPFIGHLIGFDYTEDPQLQGILEDAEQIRDRAFFSAFQFFQKTLQDQPVMVLLEDIHWADEGSLDFFERLAHECLNFPLMIVGLTRHTLFERRPSWGEAPGHVRVDLSPLSQGASQELVAEILQKAPEIPSEIYALIVSRAEGNPFYVEEVIKMLIDDGMILPGPDHWQVKQDRIVEVKIPPTLTGVLQARLDGLPPPERRVLHRASVAGRIFWDDLTARMRDSNVGGEANRVDTDGALSSLQGRELIFRNEQSNFSGTTEFIFKHAVLRDVTYESLLKQLRRTYHRQVADWLCEHSGDRVGEYAGQIGEHYERAGEPALAAKWYARAGKQAQDTYTPETARENYQKALSLWAPAGDLNEEQRLQQIEVTYGLGQVLNWLGRFAEAIEVYQDMAAAAGALGDQAMQARAWYGIAEAQMHRGDTRAAIASAARQESLARAAGSQLELSKAMWMKAWGAFKLGEKENALSLAEQVSTLSRQLHDRSQLAHSLNLLGVLDLMSGRFQEAARYFEQALETFNALGNRRRAMPLMNNLGVILEARGDYHLALDRYQQALEAARQIGNRDGEMVYLSNIGAVKVRLGDYLSGESDLRQVIQMAGSGGVDVLAFTFSFLAEACLGQDKVEQALASAQRALDLAREMESQDDQGLAWRILGRVAATRGEPVPVEGHAQGQVRMAGAEDCFAESERIFKDIEREEERARTLREWAKFKYEQGNRQEGDRLWEQAKAIFTDLGAKAEVERMENETQKQIDL